MLEKEILAPKYRLDIYADSFGMAKFICSYLLDGKLDKDYMIFKRDEKILGKETHNFETYMLN